MIKSINKIILIIIFELLSLCSFSQDINLICSIPTVSNFQIKQFNKLLYFNWLQLSDTVPGYYALIKENKITQQKNVVQTLEIVNTPLKRKILVCMQDTYEEGFDTYILKKIVIPQNLLPAKDKLKLLSVADTLYFIKVDKD
ncbi:MAG: hypothetical protein ACK4IK_11800 [Bacteroidia bacterium]